MSTLSSYIHGSLVAAVPASTSAAAVAVEDFEPAYFRGWQFRADTVQTRVDCYNRESGGRESGGKFVRQAGSGGCRESVGLVPRDGAALHLFDNLATGQPTIARSVA